MSEDTSIETPVALAGEPAVGLEQARAHGLTDDEYRTIERSLGRTPTFTELGVFSVMWSEHCSYKSSRRRNPARHLHDGRAAGRQHGFAEVRRVRASAHALPPRRRGRRNWRLWQLCRRADGRRRGDVRRGLQRQYPGQRILPRPRAARRITERARTGAWQSCDVRRLGHRARRNPWREPARLGRVRCEQRGQAPNRAGRRPIYRKTADRGVPGSDAERRDRRDPGHGRGRAYLFLERDGGARRVGNRTRPRLYSAARGGTDAVRDSALGVAGADVARSGARARGRTRSDLRALGLARRGGRQNHRRPAVAGAMARKAGRRYSGRRADRRSAGLRSSRARTVEGGLHFERRVKRDVRSIAGRGPAPSAGQSQCRFQAMGLSAVRLDGAEQYDGWAGQRCRRAQDQGNESRARAESRFQPARLRARPLRRCGGDRGGGGAQRGVCGRAADRAHQLS